MGNESPGGTLLDAANGAFVESGLSIVVAARDAANVPTLVRAYGCRVAPDRRRVSVFVAPAQCPELLEDVRSTGAVAVVFSQPSTHRTIQLKGTDAAVERLEAGDADRMARQTKAFCADLALLGFAPTMGHTLLASAGEDLVAIAFTPNAAFVQTPGPRAGAPLER